MNSRDSLLGYGTFTTRNMNSQDVPTSRRSLSIRSCLQTCHVSGTVVTEYIRAEEGEKIT
jgi:hypothetical protein